MRIRLAKKNDYKEIAKLHLKCSKEQEGGFFYKLGLPFIKKYYSIFINEKYSLILCSENDCGKLIGIVTGTLSQEEHIKAIKKNKIWLGISMLPALIKSPKNIVEVIYRYRSLRNNPRYEFIESSGARLEFWGWDKEEKELIGSIYLLEKWLLFMKDMGAKKIVHEVDDINKKSLEIHSLLGSKIKKKIYLQDGRKRFVMEYDLSNIKML